MRKITWDKRNLKFFNHGWRRNKKEHQKVSNIFFDVFTNVSRTMPLLSHEPCPFKSETPCRVCYQTAEKELAKAGLRQSSWVYSAWAGLECKARNIQKARELFQKALDVDPQCSAVCLQLGVMEADEENWDLAKDCFETVLKFDKRNSRVLQACVCTDGKQETRWR